MTNIQPEVFIINTTDLKAAKLSTTLSSAGKGNGGASSSVGVGESVSNVAKICHSFHARGLSG